jgi:hypothetical protein
MNATLMLECLQDDPDETSSSTLRPDQTMRILCLHGIGTNSAILASQTGKWIDGTTGHATSTV